MRVQVTQEVLDAFPGMEVVVVVAREVEGARGAGAAGDAWRAAWDAIGQLADEWPNAQSHPRVQPWREAWRRLGISAKKFPSSIEAILRRAMKGGDPFSIHPLVDFYNAVSLRHVVPAGGFDLAALDGLDLRLSRDGDTFQALDDSSPAPVEPGEVTWATGSVVLTRHLVWRQAQEALIQPETTDLLLVSEILAELPDGTAQEVETSLRDGIESGFGGRTTGYRLSAATPGFVVEP